MEPEYDDTSENEPATPTKTKKIEISKTGLTEIGELEVVNTLDGKGAVSAKNGGHYELMDLSTPTSKRSSTITYKISNSSDTGWPPGANTQQQAPPATATSHGHHHHHHHQRQASVRSHDLTSKNVRVQQKSVSTRITSMKRENKTTKTLSIVVGGFIACWLPFFVVYLITPFLGHDSIREGVKVFLTWLGWFNSLMNPLVYCAWSPDFRQAFWRLTLRRCFKNARRPPYGNSAMSIRR